MQTEKSKAEEFVRNKFPELRELRFGCLIRTTYCPDFEDDNELRNKINAVVVGDGFYGDRIEAVTQELVNDDWKNIQVELMKNDPTIEIIGHPITLNYWLMALGHVSLWCYPDQGFYSTIVGNKGEIKFNPSTGQPNSEEDYRTFNSIVGVNGPYG